MFVNAHKKLLWVFVFNINLPRLPFGRVEYQSRPSSGGISSFKHLLARLPPRVHSVFYRDEIGNISSSHLRIDYLKVTFLPWNGTYIFKEVFLLHIYNADSVLFLQYFFFFSQILKLSQGILCLEVGKLLLWLGMGYHWKTSFLSHLMAGDTSTSLLVVLLLRRW